MSLRLLGTDGFLQIGLKGIIWRECVVFDN